MQGPDPSLGATHVAPPTEAELHIAASQVISKDLVELAAKAVALVAILVPVVGYATRYVAFRLDGNVGSSLALVTAVPLADATALGAITLLAPAAVLVIVLIFTIPVARSARGARGVAGPTPRLSPADPSTQ